MKGWKPTDTAVKFPDKGYDYLERNFRLGKIRKGNSNNQRYLLTLARIYIAVSFEAFIVRRGIRNFMTRSWNLN